MAALRPTRRLALLVLCLAVLFTWSADQRLEAVTPYNEDDVVYMLLTDRFPDGDPSNSDLGDPGGEYQPGNLKWFQGGDWQGVLNKIDYIKNLGVTAVWFSPVQDSEDISRDGGEGGYHTYWPYDFYSTEPHFGTLAKLQELVTAAHNRGINIILDIVPNHTGDYLAPFATAYDPPDFRPAPPFNNPDWYHHNGTIDDWNDQWEVENGDLAGLDDLAQEVAAVEAELKKVYQQWFTQTGSDAARVDAARSMPKWFLQSIEQAIGLPTFGEIFHGDPAYVADYQNYEWGVLDFPLFFAMRDVIAYDKSWTAVGNIFDQDWRYVNPLRLHTFIDNHDRDRFLAHADDNWRRLRLALSFLFSARGIPVIYYGTEQAYYSGGIPQEFQGIATEKNREVLADFNENHILYKHIQRLADLRQRYEPLRRGVQREMWEDDTVYAFSRRVDGTGVEVIAAFSLSWDPQSRTIPLRTESTLAVGTELANLLNTADKVTVQSGGPTGKQMAVSLGAKEAKIYAAGVTETYMPPALNLTTIRVHYNAGQGNSVWLRGDIYPFWWDRGREARWTAGNVWVWETERIAAGQSFQFKPLVNDYTWSVGDNFAATGGTTIDVYPIFRDPADSLTRIRVHYNTGIGKSIYLRGDTSPLSWTSGVQATWTKNNAWTWETTSIPVGQKFEFKALVNDVDWSQGGNFVASGGMTIDIYAAFYTGESERTAETIRVYRDVSPGNSIYVRGSVAPLSWEVGQQATWTPQSIWVWETSQIGESTPFEFKPLINDTAWSLGNNYWSRGGMTVEVYPGF